MAIKKDPNQNYDQELRQKLDEHADRTAPMDDPIWVITSVTVDNVDQMEVEMTDEGCTYNDITVVLSRDDLLEHFAPSREYSIENLYK
jgi:anti-sigma regulatory factor (Ser/Thr protein kinase)